MDKVQGKEPNVILLCMSFIFIIIFIVEVVLALRYNSHGFQCLNEPNAVCHTDWQCVNDANGTIDSALNSKYAQLIKAKDNFLTPVPATINPNNSALSTTDPYYGCKDPSYSNSAYLPLPTLSSGSDYQFGKSDLGDYNGTKINGEIPVSSLYCIPTSGGSPAPTFLPNTGSS